MDNIRKTVNDYSVAGGIRSLDESSRLDQSEAVKVARALKQKYQKLGGGRPHPPDFLLPFVLFHQK